MKRDFQIMTSLQRLTDVYSQNFESELDDLTTKLMFSENEAGTDATTAADAQSSQNKDKKIDELQQRWERQNQLKDATKAMVSKHICLQGVWNEWYGLDSFTDSIKGREKQFGKYWWKGIVSDHLFSRTKRRISGIHRYADEHQMNEFEAIANLEDLFNECKSSVYNVLKQMKTKGLVGTKAPRGKSKAYIAKQCLNV